MHGQTEYSVFALRAIEATAVPALLRRHSAVVLERIARGGGATRWYFLDDLQQLKALAGNLAPGSSVSFYFDERVMAKPFDNAVATEIVGIAADEGEAVVGRLVPDGQEIAVDFVSGRRDLDELVPSLTQGETVFFGPFPARDNDAVRAVTLDLPDLDGVVRAHPH